MLSSELIAQAGTECTFLTKTRFDESAELLAAKLCA